MVVERKETMINDKLKVVLGDGSECLVCPKDVEKGSIALEVTATVNLVLAKKDVRMQMHIHCAEELYELLAMRIGEARMGTLTT